MTSDKDYQRMTSREDEIRELKATIEMMVGEREAATARIAKLEAAARAVLDWGKQTEGFGLDESGQLAAARYAKDWNTLRDALNSKGESDD